MTLSARFFQFITSMRCALLLLSITTIGVVTVLLAVSPIVLGPSGMLGAFAVFYLWFFAVLLTLMHFVQSIKRKKQVNADGTKLQFHFLSPQVFIVVATWSFAPVIFLALQSIGQLDFISTLLVLIFEVLATIYIMKTKQS